MVRTLGRGSPGWVLPLSPEGAGGSSALSKAWWPVSLPRLLMVRAGVDRSCARPFLAALAPVLGMSRRWVRGREGPSGPFLAVPVLRKGRAVSVTIYSVLDKCK